jgi:hypothetical protein
MSGVLKSLKVRALGKKRRLKMLSFIYPGFAHVPERLCLWSGVAAVLVVPALGVLAAFPAPHRLELHEQLCVQERRRQEVIVEPFRGKSMKCSPYSISFGKGSISYDFMMIISDKNN